MSTPPTHRIEVFQSTKNSQYYWHLKATNGQVVATGNEGFTTKFDCKASAKKVVKTFEDKNVDKSNLE